MEENQYSNEIKNCLAIAGLTEREKDMLLKYLCFPDHKYSSVELGKIYSLSHERVRCIIKSARERLSLPSNQINIANLINSGILTSEQEYYFLFNLLTDFSLLELKDLAKYFPTSEFDLLKCAFNKISLIYPDLKKIYDDNLDLILSDRTLIKPFIQKMLPEIYITIEECKKHPLKTIYDYLPNFAKTDIDHVIDSLTDEEKLVIKLFTTYTGRDMITREQKQLFYKTVKKIRRILLRTNKKTRCQTIYDFFIDYSHERVDDAIRLLPLNFRNAIKDRFNHLNQADEKGYDAIYSLFYYQVIPRIQKILQDPKFYQLISCLTIYEYFKEYSKEEVNVAISKLSFEDQKLIYLRFGNDLNNQKVNYDWSSYEEHQFYYGTLGRLGSKLKQKKVISVREINLFENFALYSEEQVLYIIQNKLTMEELGRIKYYFGEDYKSYNNNLNEKEKSDCANLCLKISRLLKKEYSLEDNKLITRTKNIYQFLNKYSLYSVNEAIKFLDKEDYDLLMYHYEDDLTNIRINHVVTYEEQLAFYRVNYRLKVILQKYFEPVENYSMSLMDYCTNQPKEQIQMILSYLTPKDKELFAKRFGKNYQGNVKEIYFTIEERKYFYGILLPGISQNSSYNFGENFFTLFDKPFYLVKRVIEILPKDYRLIIDLKYQKHKTRQYYRDKNYDYNCLNKKIIPLINNILNDEKLYQYYTYASIYQYFPEFSINEINIVLASLKEEDKQIINLRFGNDLCNPVVNYDWNSSEALYFFRKLLYQIRNSLYIMRRKYYHNGYITDFVGKYSYEELKNAVLILNMDEQNALYLKFGTDLNGSFSTRNFTYEMVINLTNAINNLQNILNFNCQKDAKNNLLIRSRNLE